jgi:hypothetical protein
MREIVFRPLRRIKKTGKITVASYMQWRKVKTADYSKFNLIVDDEYKLMPKDEYVYDHKGELLFFYTYNPAEIPIFTPPLPDIETIFDTTDARGFNYGQCTNYSGKGIDCDGVPTFSHFTADYLGTHKYDLNAFEPLTVDMVTKWFGWFIYQLNNSYLQIGK